MAQYSRNGRLGVRAGEDRANHIWSADQRRSLRVRCNSHCGQPNATRLGNFCCSSGAVKVLPCTPDNRNPTIPLGRVSTTVLESATGMSFRNFSVSLKCDQAVDITVNVNADSDAPAQGLINANQGSQAKGFVVELREHRADGSSTPFVLNTDHQYSNNGRDDTVLSFRARLKKKSATGAIALGDFSALATIQLSYE